jgi:hypothetical protein
VRLLPRDGTARAARARERVAGLIAFASIVLLAVPNLLVDGKTPWPGVAALLPVAGTAGLIVAGTLAPNPRDEGQPAACRGGLLDFTCTLPRQEVEAIQGSARAAELAFTRGRRGVTVYDPWPHFCNARVCSSVVEGRLAYWDFAHLNAIGSSLLASDLRKAMRTAIHPAKT